MVDVIAVPIAVMMLYASLWFLVALRLRRNDVADSAWGAGFIVLALVGQFTVAATSNRGILVLALMAVWGLRLSLLIANHCGEVTPWWVVWLIACSLPGGWKTDFGPVTIAALILLVSGIPLLERKYEGNLEFKEYQGGRARFFCSHPNHEGGRSCGIR